MVPAGPEGNPPRESNDIDSLLTAPPNIPALLVLKILLAASMVGSVIAAISSSLKGVLP